MVYSIVRLPSGKGFAVTHIISETEITRIGIFASRKEAIAIARLLAGWRGRVDVR